MQDFLVNVLPAVAIVLLLGLNFYFVNRRTHGQVSKTTEIWERNTRSVEENTAALKVLVEQIKASRMS